MRKELNQGCEVGGWHMKQNSPTRVFWKAYHHCLWCTRTHNPCSLNRLDRTLPGEHGFYECLYTHICCSGTFWRIPVGQFCLTWCTHTACAWMEVLVSGAHSPVCNFAISTVTWVFNVICNEQHWSGGGSADPLIGIPGPSLRCNV